MIASASALSRYSGSMSGSSISSFARMCRPSGAAMNQPSFGSVGGDGRGWDVGDTVGCGAVAVCAVCGWLAISRPSTTAATVITASAVNSGLMLDWCAVADGSGASIVFTSPQCQHRGVRRRCGRPARCLDVHRPVDAGHGGAADPYRTVAVLADPWASRPAQPRALTRHIGSGGSARGEQPLRE